MSTPTKNISTLATLSKELRDQIYLEVIDEPDKDILFHEFSRRELPRAIHATEPLLGFDRNGPFRYDALIHWVRTRNFIFEYGFEHEWGEAVDLLVQCGIDLYAEIKRVELWVWSKQMLLLRVEKLLMCSKLNVVRILIGEDMDMTAEEAASFFEGFRGPLQVKILREDEYVENEALVCEKVFQMQGVGRPLT